MIARAGPFGRWFNATTAVAMEDRVNMCALTSAANGSVRNRSRTFAMAWRRPALGVASMHAVAASASSSGCWKNVRQTGKQGRLVSDVFRDFSGWRAKRCLRPRICFCTVYKELGWDLHNQRSSSPGGQRLRQELSWQGFRASVRKTL
jgi:hypothetical protein